MPERIIQCFMLLMTALSCFGYMQRVRLLLDIRVEFLPFIVFSFIGLALMLFSLVNLLLPGVCFLFVVGLICSVIALVRRESLREFLCPGFLLFAFLSAYFLFLLYDTKLTHVDNFSHWGAILKFIMAEDGLPGYNPLVYFPAYPTGSSLLIYFFSRLSGIQAEWFWSFIQALYLSSCAVCLFSFINFHDKKKGIFLACLTLIVILSVLAADIDFADLLVDTLIPMVGFAALSFCLYYRSDLSGKIVPVLISAAFLPMIKNSGYYFSAVIIIAVLLLSKSIKLTAVPAAGCLVMNRLWTWHVQSIGPESAASYHAMTFENFSKTISEKSLEDLSTITKAYFGTVLNEGRLLPLICAVLFLAYIGVKYYKTTDKKELRGFILAGAIIYAGYVASILGMYFFSMSLGEALHVAAFDRYYRSITLFVSAYIWMIYLIIAQESPTETSPRQKAVAVVLCVFCVLCCKPQLRYYVRQTSREPTQELVIRNSFDKMIRDYKIPSEMNYVVFCDNSNAILTRVMCTYLLWPKNTYIIDEKNLPEAEEYFSRMDYYIVLEQTDENMQFLKDHGKTEMADYVW